MMILDDVLVSSQMNSVSTYATLYSRRFPVLLLLDSSPLTPLTPDSRETNCSVLRVVLVEPRWLSPDPRCDISRSVRYVSCLQRLVVAR